MENKIKVSPLACLYHDEKENRLRIEVEFPDVGEKNISLDMKKDSFCVNASTEDAEYSGCYRLGHEVEPDKTETRYENGTLKIFTPFKGWEWKEPRRTTLYVNAPVVRG